ncbi:MAG TPA: LodA/GoxA family CTQ-dependent oxidase [Thermoanaerobaculia bacterium]|nr:LodA/GoxA family CTQ-dependent oxidase [Thermoanaerobaculia bacterium]
MAFPNDLSDVLVFKIHPAIGVARVALNDDYYVFGTPPANYKSNGRMKRQAVQFRIFAYGDNHTGLGELTPAIMADLGIAAVWSARVANRKIARLEGTPLDGTDFVISAAASSDDANGGTLTGSLPDFDEGAAIPLGQITATGLFIPPRGGVHRKTAGEPVEPYPAVSKTVADTTGDGSVSVRLTQGKGKTELPTVPACIIIAPQDFSPDDDPSPNLLDFLKSELQAPPKGSSGTLHNQTAKALDDTALKSGTQEFYPGFEVSFGGRSEVIDVKSLFYKAGDSFIDPREIRVRYKSAAGDPGAVPGQLTSGLCSTWQGDFTACVGFWNENLPEQAYLDEDLNTIVPVFRREYAATDFGDELTSGDDFANHVDEVGVVRIRNSKRVETERDPGDDIVD